MEVNFFASCQAEKMASYDHERMIFVVIRLKIWYVIIMLGNLFSSCVGEKLPPDDYVKELFFQLS